MVRFAHPTLTLIIFAYLFKVIPHHLGIQLHYFILNCIEQLRKAICIIGIAANVPYKSAHCIDHTQRDKGKLIYMRLAVMISWYH